MDILSVIQKQYLSLSNKERLIADYILAKNDQIENMNISVLANQVGVSDGTVTRFCKKIGCAKFVDLKIQLSSISPRTKKQQKGDPLLQVYDFYKQVVDRTNQMMDRNALEFIAGEIFQARYIYIYGLGSSGLTANEFMLRLMRMGFQGQSISDSHLMIMNSSIASKKDLVIIFSVSGETIEVVNSAAIARKNGCRILCITSFVNSSLANNADYCFAVPNSALINKEHFFNNQFPFIYVIDLLTTIFLENAEIREKMDITVNTIIDQSHVKK